MSRQDRQGVRTPADVERKWNFGKSFAEVMGFAEDAQKAAEVAQAAADRANEAYAGLDQEQIFNLLTDNGLVQGIYRGDDGQIYINASYLKSGVIEGITIIGEEGSIGGFTMNEDTLFATYRKDFNLAPGDAATAQEIYLNWDSYTAAQQEAYLEKYDVNMNGRIDAGDSLVINRMLSGAVPNYTEGKIVLDAANPAKMIRIEITGGYRAGESISLGLGGLFANSVSAKSVSADSFACGGSSGYTGTVTVGGATVTITGGIITAIG